MPVDPQLQVMLDEAAARAAFADAIRRVARQEEKDNSMLEKR